MGKLGMKMHKAFASLGNKMNKITTKIGDKTHHVMSEVKGVSGVLKQKAQQIGATANNVIDKAQNIANKIPEINRKAINLGHTIVEKSGKASNILRKASGIAAQLTKGLADVGGNIPVIGTALKAGSKATDLLAKGAKRLDHARDVADHKINKYADVSRETIGEIEKINSRKKQEAADLAAASGGMDDGFA